MKNFFTITLVACLLVVSAQAQKRILLTDVFKEAVLCQSADSLVLVENAVLSAENLNFTYGISDILRRDFANQNVLRFDTLNNIIISCEIDISNCTIESGDMIPVQGITFMKPFAIKNTKVQVGQVMFSKCMFNQLQIKDSWLNYVIFEECRFWQHAELNRLTFGDLYVSHCEYYNGLQINEVVPQNYISFENCNFYQPVYKVPANLKKNDYFNDVVRPFGRNMLKICPLHISSVSQTPFLLSLDNNVIHADTNNLVVNIDCNLTELIVTDNVFEANVNMNWTAITEKLDFRNNTFKGYVGFTNMNFPTEINMYWEQLSGFKLADLYPLFRGGRYSVQSVYLGQNDEENADKRNFYHFIKVYQKLHDMYINDGDYESARACLVEMRDIESARLRYYYNTEGSLKTYLNWRLSQVLKSYTAYGTDPAQAIVMVVYVLLAFALIYFFFPSDWDITRHYSFFDRMKRLIQYLKSNEPFPFKGSETSARYSNYSNFKAFMQESKAEVPYIIYLLSLPMYHLQLTSFHLYDRFLRSSGIFAKPYKQLTGAKKLFISLAITGIFVMFLLYVMVHRAINAITLSINSFTTLGFGRIPTKGFARYLAVIQGLIGWFLLSLLSVALINQVIG